MEKKTIREWRQQAQTHNGLVEAASIPPTGPGSPWPKIVRGPNSRAKQGRKDCQGFTRWKISKRWTEFSSLTQEREFKRLYWIPLETESMGNGGGEKGERRNGEQQVGFVFFLWPKYIEFFFNVCRLRDHFFKGLDTSLWILKPSQYKSFQR